MTAETISVTTTIPASMDAVFGVLTDPGHHAAIDGTGWVCEPRDADRLTKSGQVFRMDMYHRNHPDGHYEVANQVREFDPPRAISWEPGTEDAGMHLDFGGWTWRYDLAPAANGGTEVRLTYDWSNATQEARDEIQFPPFDVKHLEDSLDHLAALLTPAPTAAG